MILANDRRVRPGRCQFDPTRQLSMTGSVTPVIDA